MRELEPLITDLRHSRVYETEPLHVVEQPHFLNACCAGCSPLAPRALLNELQRIERAAGRQPGERYGPRRLDLDVLLYDDQAIDEAGLTVPHPRLHERAFVLVPLRELLPDWRHPILARSVAELADALPSQGVRVYEAGDDSVGVRP